ncbi:MAG: hypothetical protein V4449_02930 [Patescibacteria group bacterium]
MLEHSSKEAGKGVRGFSPAEAQAALRAEQELEMFRFDLGLPDWDKGNKPDVEFLANVILGAFGKK